MGENGRQQVSCCMNFVANGHEGVEKTAFVSFFFGYNI